MSFLENNDDNIRIYIKTFSVEDLNKQFFSVFSFMLRKAKMRRGKKESTVLYIEHFFLQPEAALPRLSSLLYMNVFFCGFDLDFIEAVCPVSPGRVHYCKEPNGICIAAVSYC